MMIGVNIESWSEKLLTEYKDTLDEFQTVLEVLDASQTASLKSDKLYVLNTIAALKALSENKKFIPLTEVIQVPESDPFDYLKDLYWRRDDFRLAVDFYFKQKHISQKLYNDLLHYMTAISDNLNSIYLYKGNNDELILKFPSQQARALFVECLGAKNCPLIPLDTDTLIFQAYNSETYSSEKEWIAIFPNIATRNNVYNFLGLNNEIATCESKATLSFKKDHHFIPYNKMHPLLQARKVLLEALKNNNVDAVTAMFKKGVDYQNTGLNEFVLNEKNEDPSQTEKQTQKECLYHALVRCHLSLKAALQKPIFDRVLAASKQEGPYQKEDQYIILNNLIKGHYAPEEGPVEIGQVKLMSEEEVKDNNIARQDRSQLLIILYAYELDEFNTLKSTLESICGVGKDANNKEELYQQVLNKLTELHKEQNLLAKGKKEESHAILVSNPAYELVKMAWRIKALRIEIKKLQGEPVKPLTEEANALLKQEADAKAAIKAAEDAKAKQEQEAKAAAALQLAQNKAKKAQAKKELARKTLFRKLQIALISFITFGSGMAYVGGYSPLVIALSSGGAAIALVIGVFYVPNLLRSAYAHFKRTPKERYEYAESQLSKDLKKIQKQFTATSDKDYVQNLEQLRNQVPRKLFEKNGNEIANQPKLDKIAFMKFERQALQNVIPLEGDARNKKIAENIEENKIRLRYALK